MLDSIADFEQGWDVHVKKLQKYELSYDKFQNWQQLPTEHLSAEDTVQFSGAKMFWFNAKTGDKQLEHPGKKYFQINKKSMRKRAEEKFQSDILDKIQLEKLQYEE